MIGPSSRIDDKVLAEALRDVVGTAAEQPLREGPQAVTHLVRSLMADPSTARRLLDAVMARATEHCTENVPPVEFGPVATDSGVFDDRTPLLDPAGSPEFEAALDSLNHLHK